MRNLPRQLRQAKKSHGARACASSRELAQARLINYRPANRPVTLPLVNDGAAPLRRSERRRYEACIRGMQFQELNKARQRVRPSHTCNLRVRIIDASPLATSRESLANERALSRGALARSRRINGRIDALQSILI